MQSEISGVRTLLDMDQVAAALATSKETLRYWRARREGPRSFRMGGRVRYYAEDVQAWLDQQQQQADQEAGPIAGDHALSVDQPSRSAI